MRSILHGACNYAARAAVLRRERPVATARILVTVCADAHTDRAATCAKSIIRAPAASIVRERSATVRESARQWCGPRFRLLGVFHLALARNGGTDVAFGASIIGERRTHYPRIFVVFRRSGEPATVGVDGLFRHRAATRSGSARRPSTLKGAVSEPDEVHSLVTAP